METARTRTRRDSKTRSARAAFTRQLAQGLGLLAGRTITIAADDEPVESSCLPAEGEAFLWSADPGGTATHGLLLEETFVGNLSESITSGANAPTDSLAALTELIGGAFGSAFASKSSPPLLGKCVVSARVAGNFPEESAGASLFQSPVITGFVRDSAGFEGHFWLVGPGMHPSLPAEDEIPPADPEEGNAREKVGRVGRVRRTRIRELWCLGNAQLSERLESVLSGVKIRVIENAEELAKKLIPKQRPAILVVLVAAGEEEQLETIALSAWKGGLRRSRIWVLLENPVKSVVLQCARSGLFNILPATVDESVLRARLPNLN